MSNDPFERRDLRATTTLLPAGSILLEVQQYASLEY